MGSSRVGSNPTRSELFHFFSNAFFVVLFYIRTWFISQARRDANPPVVFLISGNGCNLSDYTHMHGIPLTIFLHFCVSRINREKLFSFPTHVNLSLLLNQASKTLFTYTLFKRIMFISRFRSESVFVNLWIRLHLAIYQSTVVFLCAGLDQGSLEILI